MDRFIIEGGHRLEGSVPIGGAKNSALKLAAAALLTDEEVILDNVPEIADMRMMASLIRSLGREAEHPAPHRLVFRGAVNRAEAPYEVVSKMRASILVLGPLLTKLGHAEVSLPGGCAIGTRPVDLHLKGLEKLGARITLEEGYIKARAPDGLKGAQLALPFPSVGATENLMMAAVLAEGETQIINAAREPEIVDLVRFLKAMGAKISGEATGSLRITGVRRLRGCRYKVMADRIEAGTYALAACITGGNLLLENAFLKEQEIVYTALESAGAEISQEGKGIRVRGTGRIAPLDLTTEPYPGFPTDMQAQFMACLALGDGVSTITETIFENRFMHVPELIRMGAHISLKGRQAVIKGGKHLSGAKVMATDLRASFSLILAALAARGQSEISRIYHLDRGYENVEEKLSACGASIRRIRE